MRDNPVKKALQAGEHGVGTMVMEFFVPSLPQILRVAGAEFALFDMEHTGAGLDTMKAQIAACRGIGLTPFIRTPTPEYGRHYISQALDIGALGVMVPMIDTADQARAVVNATRYPPVGRRGAVFPSAHDDYEVGSVTEKMAIANERTMVLAQIETAEGLAAVDEIAAVDGVDVLWMGHFDLTAFMGITGEFKNPEYLRAVDRIVAAAEKHGKVAGLVVADDADARDYISRGFRIVSYGIEHVLLRQTLASGLTNMRAFIAERAAKSGES